MNATALQAQISGAVNFAIKSKETTIAEAIAALEVVKLDLYMFAKDVSDKAAQAEKRIHRPNGLS